MGGLGGPGGGGAGVLILGGAEHLCKLLDPGTLQTGHALLKNSGYLCWGSLQQVFWSFESILGSPDIDVNDYIVLRNYELWWPEVHGTQIGTTICRW